MRYSVDKRERLFSSTEALDKETPGREWKKHNISIWEHNKITNLYQLLPVMEILQSILRFFKRARMVAEFR
jgi:hypothetical protein